MASLINLQEMLLSNGWRQERVSVIHISPGTAASSFEQSVLHKGAGVPTRSIECTSHWLLALRYSPKRVGSGPFCPPLSPGL